jgi:hypothetical protein
MNYGSDDVVPNPESRAKLYDRLVQRYARTWGYKAFRADNGDLVIYELSRLKQGVDEAFSIPSMADIKNKIPTKEGVKNWLLKFKNGLSQEAGESKEMMDVYVRYMNGFPVSKEEMDIANQQVKDVVRMLGLGAYALLPGHVITAPVIFRLAKKYNIELFPSAFRDQPVQEKMRMGATIEPIEEDDVIPHMVKDLTGKGAPIAKLRAARDKEQMKKRERSDGLPVEPKFDYLDEK